MAGVFDLDRYLDKAERLYLVDGLDQFTFPIRLTTSIKSKSRALETEISKHSGIKITQFSDRKTEGLKIGIPSEIAFNREFLEKKRPEIRKINVRLTEALQAASKIDLQRFIATCFGDVKKRYDRLPAATAAAEYLLRNTEQVAGLPDVENYLGKLIKEEEAFDRALLFSDLWITLGNLLGNDKRFSMTDWKPPGEACENKVTRPVSWISTQAEKVTEIPDLPNLRPGEGEPPSEMFDLEGVKHQDISASDIIDIPLWDKAKWDAVGVVAYPNYPPILLIGFKNLDAGKKIFEGLRGRVGDSDSEERVIVSIVRGIYASHPFSYGVMIGPNPEKLVKHGQRAFLVSRMNHMRPESPASMNGFLSHYKSMGQYFIAPCDMKNLMGNDLQDLVKNYGILKKNINLKEAWQIGENDQELSLLDEDEMPIIPLGMLDPPVLKSLTRIREMRNRKKP